MSRITSAKGLLADESAVLMGRLIFVKYLKFGRTKSQRPVFLLILEIWP